MLDRGSVIEWIRDLDWDHWKMVFGFSLLPEHFLDATGAYSLLKVKGGVYILMINGE